MEDRCSTEGDGECQASTWEEAYRRNARLWGDRPSEIAEIAANYVREQISTPGKLTLLDIGCGYGRDDIYLASQLGLSITGIDRSSQAITLAAEALTTLDLDNVRFVCADLATFSGEVYDLILVSNLYHLLDGAARQQLGERVTELLRPNGLLFLNALSTSDPEEYGQGEPVADDTNSFVTDKFRHFATPAELHDTFLSLSAQALYERPYDEPHPGGRTHHHVAWILIAQKRAADPL